MNNFFSRNKSHLVAVIVFIAISYAYMLPQLQGKKLQQHDSATFKGMSKEVGDFREKTGEEIYWTNSMFGGMPTYLISARFEGNVIKKVDYLMKIGKRPAAYLFIAFICFYILLLAYGVNPWLSIIGALAYGLSSYFLIILQAGHNTKAVALAYIPAVIAGIHLVFSGKRLLGAGLFGVFLALELLANHVQITYYFAMAIVVFGLFELYNAIVAKKIKPFMVNLAILVGVATLALATNFTQIYYTVEYGKESIRGKTELSTEKDNRTTGLDKDYTVAWSYGRTESFNMLIPNLMGGASKGFDKDSETYKKMRKLGGRQAADMVKQMPLAYWGDQPGTSGPMYLGAIIVFLFVFGLFYVKGNVKWWLLAASALSVLLAWGSNFMWLTNIFLDYLPGYNKFRAPSVILVIVQLTVPLLGFIALKRLFTNREDSGSALKALKWSTGIVGGICLLFLMFGTSMFDFSASIDTQLKAYGWPVESIVNDRISLLRADSLRSLLFVLGTAVVLFLFIKSKLKTIYVYIILGLLVVIDLWSVDKRYLNEDHFAIAKKVDNPYPMTNADKQILMDKDPNYRVLNLSVSPLQDASTSYYHKSIGGYHGAKIRRFQELYEHQIAKNNMQVLNMLNVKYIIVPGQNSAPMVQRNVDALSNGWFVNNVKVVDNADQELAALSEFNAGETAIVDKRFSNKLKGYKPANDSLADITLIDYRPDLLTYQSRSTTENLAVFSEIYYPKGWEVVINDKPAECFRVNYVLRGLIVPSGENIITFRFVPKMLGIGKIISLFSSIFVLILLILGLLSEAGTLKKLGICRQKKE